jgi:hypothetical protein
MSRFDCHQVYMYFFKRGGWEVQFLLPDLKTPLPPKLTFADPEKIRELARRGEALGTSEAKQILEYAIEVGRGGIYLRLTPEQFATRPYPMRLYSARNHAKEKFPLTTPRWST